MSRRILVLITIVSTLTVVASAANTQEPTSKKAGRPKPNPVYVKIIMPADPAIKNEDQSGVESWIAEDLKKRGQSKFSAVTAWIPLVVKGEKFEDPTPVWEGGCRVHAQTAPPSSR